MGRHRRGSISTTLILVIVLTLCFSTAASAQTFVGGGTGGGTVIPGKAVAYCTTAATYTNWLSGTKKELNVGYVDVSADIGSGYDAWVLFDTWDTAPIRVGTLRALIGAQPLVNQTSLEKRIVHLSGSYWDGPATCVKFAGQLFSGVTIGAGGKNFGNKWSATAFSWQTGWESTYSAERAAPVFSSCLDTSVVDVVYEYRRTVYQKSDNASVVGKAYDGWYAYSPIKYIRWYPRTNADGSVTAVKLESYSSMPAEVPVSDVRRSCVYCSTGSFSEGSVPDKLSETALSSYLGISGDPDAGMVYAKYVEGKPSFISPMKGKPITQFLTLSQNIDGKDIINELITQSNDIQSDKTFASVSSKAEEAYNKMFGDLASNISYDSYLKNITDNKRILEDEMELFLEENEIDSMIEEKIEGILAKLEVIYNLAIEAANMISNSALGRDFYYPFETLNQTYDVGFNSAVSSPITVTVANKVGTDYKAAKYTIWGSIAPWGAPTKITSGEFDIAANATQTFTFQGLVGKMVKYWAKVDMDTDLRKKLEITFSQMGVNCTIQTTDNAAEWRR